MSNYDEATTRAIAEIDKRRPYQDFDCPALAEVLQGLQAELSESPAPSPGRKAEINAIINAVEKEQKIKRC
jgi:hypothetical protein